MAENKEEIKQEVAVKEETKSPVVAQRNMIADLNNGIYSSSDTFKLATQMAKGLACSTIVPQQFQRNEANCLIALEYANRLNISPMMVMQNLHVIQGRPSFSSSFLIAMINASGKYDIELQFDVKKDKDGKPLSCICWTEKDGRRVEGITVDMEMAKKEGWLGKSGSKWQTIPEVMLRYRSASFFARLNCPELALGLYTREELLESDFSEHKSNKSSLADALKDDDLDIVEVIE